MLPSSILVKAGVQDNSVFNTTLNYNGLQEEDTEENNDINEDINNQNTKKNGLHFPSLIELISGSSLRFSDGNNLDTETSVPTLMEEEKGK